MNIEANLNTISLLEPIFKRIQSMSEEEKSSFKLPVGLGGPSKTIYQRIIKKIYGKEQGSEVIEMLHNQPLQAVPIILKRLRQKDEEWRKSQVNENIYIYIYSSRSTHPYISVNGIRCGVRLRSKTITKL